VVGGNGLEPMTSCVYTVWTNLTPACVKGNIIKTKVYACFYLRENETETGMNICKKGDI